MQAQDIAREKAEMAMVNSEAVARAKKQVNFGRNKSDICFKIYPKGLKNVI